MTRLTINLHRALADHFGGTSLHLPAVIDLDDLLEFADAEENLDLEAHLARERKVAVVWSHEDVLELRPDLDPDQAWEVLRAARRCHDVLIGLDWDLLRVAAERLFGPAPIPTKGGGHE